MDLVVYKNFQRYQIARTVFEAFVASSEGKNLFCEESARWAFKAADAFLKVAEEKMGGESNTNKGDR